jgi:hypothetical protein
MHVSPVTATERRNRDRLLVERIRALDPTLLDCGPECQHFERHVETDWTTYVQCTRCLAEIPANVDDDNGTYDDAGCPNGCDDERHVEPAWSDLIDAAPAIDAATREALS